MKTSGNDLMGGRMMLEREAHHMELHIKFPHCKDVLVYVTDLKSEDPSELEIRSLFSFQISANL